MDNRYTFSAEGQQLYITKMRPLLRKGALFSDTTADYVTPCQPRSYDILKIRFRAAVDNIDRVSLVVRGMKYQMYKYRTEGDFDYYETDYQLDNADLLFRSGCRKAGVLLRHQRNSEES